VIDRKCTSGTCHFLDLLLYVGRLVSSLLLHSPPPRPGMYLLLPDILDSANHERL
jgi:hypothetical protein